MATQLLVSVRAVSIAAKTMREITRPTRAGDNPSANLTMNNEELL